MRVGIRRGYGNPPEGPSVKKPYSHQPSFYITPDGFRLATVKSDGFESEDDSDEGGGNGNSEGAPAEGYFEDLVPKAIPLGRTESNEHVSDNREWVENARLPPGLQKAPRTGKDAVVLHRAPFLHRLGVPNGHRAHYVLSVENLEKIHRVVYEKGAKYFFAEEGLVKDIQGDE